MLSKVAERVYWTARYLERVENTARLVLVYDNLLFDLPRSVNFGWYNLILINSSQDSFAERYTNRDERNVVKFMLGDENNYSSIVNSLKMIRENVRTTRDVIPEETWELTNELSMFVEDNLQQGINRSKRRVFLDGVIKGCQQILGLLYGTMAHDAAWYFLRLGRNLERADMTTRIVDAGSAAVLALSDENAINSRQIIWGNVLRSVGAEQSYRRTTRASIRGADVVYYLLEDKEFPRTIAHAMQAIQSSANYLPRSQAVTKFIDSLVENIYDEVDYGQLGDPLRDYLNDLQMDIAAIHKLIADTWFPSVGSQEQ
jgi:uncharacterized alpha-E superfamily protein